MRVESQRSDSKQINKGGNEGGGTRKRKRTAKKTRQGWYEIPFLSKRKNERDQGKIRERNRAETGRKRKSTCRVKRRRA